MAMIKCPECGSDVSEKALACPKCGCPIDNLKNDMIDNKKFNKNYLYIGIFILLLIVITSVFVFKKINRPDSNGYFEGIRWGASYSDVKKQLGEVARDGKTGNALVASYKDYKGKKGIEGTAVLTFIDDSLDDVMLFVRVEEDSSYTDEKVLNELVQELNKQYGEHDRAELPYYWNTPKSKITLHYLTDGFFTIQYQDITKVEN
jgi:hypothetical protein